jgi:hypothetical protein
VFVEVVELEREHPPINSSCMRKKKVPNKIIPDVWYKQDKTGQKWDT